MNEYCNYLDDGICTADNHTLLSIQKCVNEHDSLVAEVERLKQETELIKQSYNGRLADLEGVICNMSIYNDSLRQENEQLREALWMCSKYFLANKEVNENE